MEFNECIKTRRSIRKYIDKKIEQDTIKKIIEATLFAPSWKHTQVARYYIVLDPIKKKAITDSMPDFNILQCESAPCLIVSTMFKNRSGYNRDGTFSTNKEKGWQMYDCGISNYLFTLEAHNQGLGTVIMGIYDEEVINKTLDIPKSEEIAVVIALGYYDEDGQLPKQRNVEDIYCIK